MSLRCPKCGATYGAAARYCTRDGTPLSAHAPIVPLSPDALEGQVIEGRYRIEQKVGEGGMSFVYLAHDLETGARDAIKVLSTSLSRDRTAMERLKREAGFGQRLEHPSICHIKRLGQTPDGLVYVVMPFLEGEILADRTYRLKQLPLPEVTGFVQEIASGLQLAHELGIVHRDLKPENVMITHDAQGKDHAVVMDFGLAKERRAGAELMKLTATGIVLGTPEFMSPEQLRGKPLDGRTDVYALALMTTEMLTGKLPFDGSSQQELMLARLRDNPTPVRRLRPDLAFSPEVERVLLKGLERNPGDRYASAPQFAEALATASTPGPLAGTQSMLKKIFGGFVLALCFGHAALAQSTASGGASSTTKSPTKKTASSAAAKPATPPPPPPDTTPKFSGALGVAVDSIHGGPLVGATVVIEGAHRQGITDSTGQFRIDSVPPGRYKLSLYHPVLDSVGVGITSQPINFPAGRYAVVRVATPSDITVANMYCPSDKRTGGPSSFIGRVLDPDTEQPDSGAHVVLYWQQMEFGQAIGIRRISRVREANVDANGMFAICGIPDSIRAVMRASRGSMATAGVGIAVGGRLLVLGMVFLASPDTVTVASADTTHGGTPAPAPRANAPRHGNAILTGRILDQGGKPLQGAIVGVLGASSTAMTDDSGRFTVHGLPSGTQDVLVKKLSYSPVQMPVSLTIRQATTLNLAMRIAPPQLATVNVNVDKVAQGLKKVGFTDRKKMGLGHFMTEDDINEHQPQIMTDVFTTMPGITVSYSSGKPVLQGSRTAGGGCVAYYIDDVPYKEQTPGDINDYMRPEELSAVEVYNSSDVPAQYSQLGKSECTTIVMWTKTKIGG